MSRFKFGVGGPRRGLPRRLFLRGAAGVAVGLPLLESLGGVSEAGAQGERFRYALFLRQGNGVFQQKFWPVSADVALTKARLQEDAMNEDRTVGVLADYAEKLNLVHGLQYKFSGSGCGHADGCLQCLTSAKRNGNFSNETRALGPSLDWVISQALDAPGSEPVSLYAGATADYLGDLILYRGPEQLRAGERNPINAYQRLFGTSMPDEMDRARLALQRKSVNDLVRQQMQALLGRPELSAADRQRLDQHFQAIRDLENDMAGGCVISPLGEFDPENVDQVVKTHLDLLALAMACGKSHTGSLCVGNGNDQTQYMIDGRKLERFHHISHRIHADGGEGEPIPDAEDSHHKIDKMFAGFFKHLLDRLSSYTTPTGTLLDDGVCAWLNDLGDGPGHSSKNLPWVLAGGAGGTLKTGNYLKGTWTINKVHNTIGAAVGLTNDAGEPLDDFGDEEYDKGRLSELFA
jgi:hypothetical protein